MICSLKISSSHHYDFILMTISSRINDLQSENMMIICKFSIHNYANDLQSKDLTIIFTVKSFCSNFVVISNDDKITVNHFVVILSSFQALK